MTPRRRAMQEIATVVRTLAPIVKRSGLSLDEAIEYFQWNLRRVVEHDCPECQQGSTAWHDRASDLWVHAQPCGLIVPCKRANPSQDVIENQWCESRPIDLSATVRDSREGSRPYHCPVCSRLVMPRSVKRRVVTLARHRRIAP